MNKQPYTVMTLDEEWWSEANVETGLAVEQPIADHEADEVDRPTDMLSFPLSVRANNNPELQAILVSSKGEMMFGDVSYSSPSPAGKVASGWKACNGLRYWQYQHPTTKEWRLIAELRAG